MRRRSFVCGYLLATFLLAQIASARQPVEISLEGRVEAVYLSIKISDPVYVIQIESKSVALSGDSQREYGRQLPSPGDTVFATFHGGQRQRTTGAASDGLPTVGQQIRAELLSTTPGKWEAAGSSWFEVVNAASLDNRSTTNDANTDSPRLDLRGMSCEAKIISGQIAFEVKSVEATGPAKEAGFQVGDIIAAVAGKPVASVAALKELVAKPGELELTVIDINTGRLAKVALTSARVAPTLPPASEKPAQVDEAASTVRIATALGITVIPSRIGIRQTAVAVTKVDPTGGGAETGLEVSDVILAVNDKPVASADDFAAALPPSGGTVTLLVRDSRSGDDVPIQAICKKSGAAPTTQAPPPTKRTAPAGPADDLGLSTELAFYQAEAAVQVVAVQPGTPASRAGIQPGWIILSVNGKPVLHPDELKRVVSGSQGAIGMTVADPNSHREMKINISR